MGGSRFSDMKWIKTSKRKPTEKEIEENSNFLCKYVYHNGNTQEIVMRFHVNDEGEFWIGDHNAFGLFEWLEPDYWAIIPPLK